MIPEPTTELWLWLRAFTDAYLWPAVDEDAAMRLGNTWHDVGLAMAESVAQANAANAELPAVWRDATGILYQRNIDKSLNGDGYASTVDSFDEMAQMCWEIARTVGQIKDQIYSELIMNAIFFAATFAMPPGIGDFFRWRLLASLAERFSGLIRTAAGLIEHTGVDASRAFATLKAFVWEGGEEAVTELTAENLDIQRGFRPNGVDWEQVGVSTGAGIGGSLLAHGLNRVGRVGSAPAGRLADALRLGDRGKTVMEQSAHAFVVNSVTSPVSSVGAQAVADGDVATLVNPAAYGRAIVTGGLVAGALGASRISTVHAGDYLGQKASDTVRTIRGMAPYTPPPSPHTPTPASPTPAPATPTPAGPTNSTPTASDTASPGTSNVGTSNATSPSTAGSTTSATAPGSSSSGSSTAGSSSTASSSTASSSTGASGSTSGSLSGGGHTSTTHAPTGTSTSNHAQQSDQPHNPNPTRQQQAEDHQTEQQQRPTQDTSDTAHDTSDAAQETSGSTQDPSNATDHSDQTQAAPNTTQATTDATSPTQSTSPNADSHSTPAQPANTQSTTPTQAATTAPQPTATTQPTGPAQTTTTQDASTQDAPIQQGAIPSQSSTPSPNSPDARPTKQPSIRPDSETSTAATPDSAPVTPNPSTEQSATENSAPERSGPEQSTAEESTGEESTAEQPTADSDPVVAQSTADSDVPAPGQTTGAAAEQVTGAAAAARTAQPALVQPTQQPTPTNQGSSRPTPVHTATSQQPTTRQPAGSSQTTTDATPTEQPTALEEQSRVPTVDGSPPTRPAATPATRPAGTPATQPAGPPAGPPAPPVDPMATASEGPEEFGWFNPDSPVVADREPNGAGVTRTDWHSSGDPQSVDPGMRPPVRAWQNPDIQVGPNWVRWVYETATGFPRIAEAILHADFGTQNRSPEDTAARNEARGRGIDGDEGGHAIAWRFFQQVLGKTNHFPQAQAFNRGAFRGLENEIGDWIAAGWRVNLRVFFPPNEPRPSSLTVVYDVVDPADPDITLWTGGRTWQNTAEPHAAELPAPGRPKNPLPAGTEKRRPTQYQRFPLQRIQEFDQDHSNLFTPDDGDPTTSTPPQPPTPPDTALGRIGDSVTFNPGESSVTQTVPSQLITDPEALTDLQQHWLDLHTSGYEVEVTVVRVPRPGPASDPLRFSVEVTDPRAVDPSDRRDYYGPSSAAELADQMIARLESPPGRHRVDDQSVHSQPRGPLDQVGDSISFRAVDVDVLQQLPWSLVADPQLLTDLQQRWAELEAAGYQVEVTIARVPRPTPASDPLRFTVEVTDPNAVDPVDAADHYGPSTVSELAEQMITSQQSTPGRHRVDDQSIADQDALDQLQRRREELEASSPGRHRGGEQSLEATPEPRPRARFVAGWVMVSELSGRVLPTLTGSVTGIRSIVDQGNGLYVVETEEGTRFRFVKRVGVIDSDSVMEWTLRFDGDPLVEVTLSDLLLQDDIAPLLARVLAEVRVELQPGAATAEVGSDAGKVFRADGDPARDAVLRGEDVGDRVELHYRSEAHDEAARTELLRRNWIRAELAKLINAMGVADSQPNAALLRALLTDHERSTIGRFQDRSPTNDDRVSRTAYLAKAAKSSAWSGVLLGAAATMYTGDPLIGLGMAVPTVANSLISALSERRLDAHKDAGRKPAYDADRARRDQDYPGLKVFLDGEPNTPDIPAKPPRATKQRNYLVRHAIPTLSTAAVAGALTLLGVPAMSTALVTATSALAKSLAERVVDKQKFDFRLARVDATVRDQLADPEAFQNQLVAELAELRTRLDRALSHAIGVDLTRLEPGLAPYDASNTPGTPPLNVYLSAQGIDNVSSAARRVAFGNSSGADSDPTELAKHVSLQIEGLLNAIGPAIVGGIAGAFGDRFFTNREEAANDAQKNWDHAEREARQATALAAALRERFTEIEQLVEYVEQAVGVPSQASRVADRAGFPAAPAEPAGTRPGGQSPMAIYAAQVAAAAIGGVIGVIGLDLIFDLPDLGVMLTLAGVAGAMTGTPFARYAFRRAEINRKDRLADVLAKQAVDRGRLVEQVAIANYALEQVRFRARRTVELSGLAVPGAVAGEFADRVRAAVRAALLENVPDPSLSAHNRDVLRERIERLERVDQLASALDQVEAEGAPERILAGARARVLHAIDLYGRVADSNGRRRVMPELGSVDPGLGQRVVGGRTAQIRVAVEQAVRMLIAEPAGKKVLLERLVAVEQLKRAADAVEHHAVHGTPESRALLGEELEDRLEAVHELWREAGAPDGLSLPALSVAPGLSRVGGEVVVQFTAPGSLESNHGRMVFPESVPPDGTTLSRLEGIWSDLVSRGYEVAVTVHRVARPAPDADPYRYTVEISDPSTLEADHYGPSNATALEAALTPLTTPGRHHTTTAHPALTATSAPTGNPGTSTTSMPTINPVPTVAPAPTVSPATATTSASPAPVPSSPSTQSSSPRVSAEVAKALGDAVVEVLPGALPLQDGGFRETLADGRQIVLPGSVFEQIADQLARVDAADVNAEAKRLLTEAFAHENTRSTTMSTTPEDALRAAARRQAAEVIARQAERLDPTTPPGETPAPAPTSVDTTTPTPPQGPPDRTGPSDGTGSSDGTRASDGTGDTGGTHPGGGRVHAPVVEGTRFVVGGPGGLTVVEAMEAVQETRADDFGDGVAQPRVAGGLVVVETGDGAQHFRVEVGEIRGRRVARTQLHRGTAAEPHVVRFADGLAKSQLPRAWVHEISHTLQELDAPQEGVARRIWNRLTRQTDNACVNAQFNEFRLLSRTWAAAAQTNNPTEEHLLRNDIEGLLKAIDRRGQIPPTPPWYAGTVPTGPPLAQLTADVQSQIAALTDAEAALKARIDAHVDQATAADTAVQEAQEKETKATNGKDNGRHARLREARKEIRKQTDLATWHRELAANYQRALDQAGHVRLGYEQLLSRTDLAAAARTLADEVAAYEQTAAEITPPAIVLSSLMPTGRLPHLRGLAGRINDVLAAHGIDERVAPGRLQHRLAAEFGRLGTDQGAVLRFGTARPGDVRIKLTAAELVEVLNPPAKASEVMIGLLPQGGRRLATARNGRFGSTTGLSLTTLTKVFGDASWMHALGEVLSLRVEASTSRTRGVTANAAEYSQDGAVEDNRGESVLFTGKASWELEVRRSAADDWVPAGEVADSNDELRGWISHAYTVQAPPEQVQRTDLATNPPEGLPAHVPVAITGLQDLSDQVVSRFRTQLGKLGRGAGRLVRDQIQAALTEDLPGRLSESTEQAVIRPLVAGGKPVGHLQIRTKVRYEEVELVGAPSRTHWQERVRVGFSTVSGQQSFSAGESISGTVGYAGDELTDIDDSGVTVGPTSGAGRNVTRSESMTGGGTAIQVGVQRFTGPTQGYRMVLDHEVTLVLGTEVAGSVTGTSESLLRLHANDAYRHGLPVPTSTLMLDDNGSPMVSDGRQVLEGDVQRDLDVPGRRRELPEWAGVGADQIRGSGPWMVQGVTGGKEALAAIIERLTGTGFLPVLDQNGDPDPTQLSKDPLERHAQLLNLAELRAQLSTTRLEAGYDIAAQTGILISLNHPRSGRRGDTVTFRIAIEQRTAKPVGVTEHEAMVTLNIGSDTAGRSGGRSKSLPWKASPLGLTDTNGALVAKVGAGYSRQSLGRAIGWFTGGTVNQVTLVESTSPVAVFEIAHRLVVTELTKTGPQPVHQGSPGTSAKVIIDSDLLPYADSPGGTEVTEGPIAGEVLDRATILALDTRDLVEWLPPALRSEPTVRQQLAAFLNPRNLIAHPEWSQAVYRTAAVVRGWGIASRRSTVSLGGRIRDARLVSVTDGVSGDINLALGNHGIYAGTTTGGTANLSDGAIEDGRGGTISATVGRNSARSQTEQSIWGVERLMIEVGRHYVFAAGVDFDLAVDNQPPTSSRASTVFQLAERDALQFYGRGALELPLHQVADAVERYLDGNLELDRRSATALVRRYRAALSAASPAATPELSADHTAGRLTAKLLVPNPQPRQNPLPTNPDARLDAVLTEVENAAEIPVALPSQYRGNLGSSLVESVGLNDESGNVRLLDQVKSLLGELGVATDRDPVLAESLFVDLAGKRWWGRLDDMLAPDGFSRSYPVVVPGALKSQRVSVRVRASFTDETMALGRTGDTISIVQRYLYGEQGRTSSAGRSDGIGPDPSINAGTGTSISTDRTSGVSTSETEQLTRLERMATFDGLNRVRRGVRLTVEVVHEPAWGGPTKGRIARAVATDVAIPRTADLSGTLVQLVPGTLPRPMAARDEHAGLVVLPESYFVESTVGSELLSAVRDELSKRELLNQAGVRQHEAALEAVFSAAARDAAFSRMAAEGGFRVVRLEVPGYASQFVDVTVRARVNAVELVGEPMDGVEIGEVNRVQHTVAVTTTSGRMLPVGGGGTLTDTDLDVSGGVSAGDQLSDSVSDVRGARRERSRFEKGEVVTVKVKVEYDVNLSRTRITRSGTERELTSDPITTTPTGEAFLTMFRHDYEAIVADLTPPRPTATPPTTPLVPSTAAMSPPSASSVPEPPSTPPPPPTTDGRSSDQRPVSGRPAGGTTLAAIGYQAALRRARAVAEKLARENASEPVIRRMPPG